MKRLCSRKNSSSIIRLAFALAALLGIVCFGALETHATVYFVKYDATGSQDGLSWGNAFHDLQPALDAAVSSDEIWVAAGIYNPTSNYGYSSLGSRGYHFEMKNGVGIYGGFAGTETARGERNWGTNETILSGDIGTPDDDSDNCYNVIYNRYLNSTAVIDGFTITGGNANCNIEGYYRLYGGGFYNALSSVTISNCVIRGNRAGSSAASDGRGGGIYNYCNSPTITNCIIEDNSCDIFCGGGIYNEGYDSSYPCNPTVTNCRFENNSAVYGGGMYSMNYCNLAVTNCEFIENKAVAWDGSRGGGMETNNYSSLAITNCRFIENHSDGYGGGMAFSNSNPAYAATITNCLFFGNTAIWGGGMVFSGGSGGDQLINSTFSGNSVNNSTAAYPSLTTAYGGGIAFFTAPPAIKNTIIWGNSTDATGEGPETYVYYYGAPTFPTFSYCDIKGSGGSGAWNAAMGTDGGENIDADPKFVNPTSGDLHLQSGSPCIDTGDNSAVSGVTTDLDGNDRIVDGTVDRGCYEYLSVSPVPTVQGIPTLSEWGVIVFALLMAAVAIVFLRRRNMTA